MNLPIRWPFMELSSSFAEVLWAHTLVLMRQSAAAVPNLPVLTDNKILGQE